MFNFVCNVCTKYVLFRVMFNELHMGCAQKRVYVLMYNARYFCPISAKIQICPQIIINLHEYPLYLCIQTKLRRFEMTAPT
jgi:hypothetical protein